MRLETSVQVILHVLKYLAKTKMLEVLQRYSVVMLLWLYILIFIGGTFYSQGSLCSFAGAWNWIRCLVVSSLWLFRANKLFAVLRVPYRKAWNYCLWSFFFSRRHLTWQFLKYPWRSLCAGCFYFVLTFWHRSFTFKFWHILYVKCE
jgi:hypothetical protein